jgi:hypothetical protein
LEVSKIKKMGRVKDLLYDGPDGFNDWKSDKEWMPDHEWFFNPDSRHWDAEYEEWSNSDGDVVDALQYASKSIIIEPEEVGKEVYDRLFSEKVVEYLNKFNE